VETQTEAPHFLVLFIASSTLSLGYSWLSEISVGQVSETELLGLLLEPINSSGVALVLALWVLPLGPGVPPTTPQLWDPMLTWRKKLVPVERWAKGEEAGCIICI